MGVEAPDTDPEPGDSPEGTADSGELLVLEALDAWDARQSSGEMLEVDAFCEEYPAVIRDSLRAQLEMLAVLDGVRPPPLPETLGEYRVGSEIGRGGMGVVFRGQDERLDRPVAIKVVAVDPLRRERSARFLREARALARIDHPNVVRVYSMGSAGAWLYMAMELLEGSVAQGRDGLPAPGRARWVEAIRIVREAAAGVACCHEHGILHRDLKLENLMLDADGVVKVGDFGIANVADEPRLTRTGLSYGTPGYAAPEQSAGAETDARTDVYGLSACLYTLVVGEAPPPMGDPDLPRDLPVGLRDVLSRGLAALPARRFGSVVEMSAALQSASLEHAPGRRTTLAAVTLGALGVAAIAGVAVLGGDGPGVSEDTGAPAQTGADAAPAVETIGPPGADVIDFYRRDRAEEEPPPHEELGPQSAPMRRSSLWESRLGELLESRDPATAVERAFEEHGQQYSVRVGAERDAVELRLTHEGREVGLARLTTAQLGTTEGWGIFREITDEDGDGRKEVTLVRLDETTAAIAVLKWHPGVWVDGEPGAHGWRRKLEAPLAYSGPIRVRASAEEDVAIDIVRVRRLGPEPAAWLETLDGQGRPDPGDTPRLLSGVWPAAPRVDASVSDAPWWVGDRLRMDPPATMKVVWSWLEDPAARVESWQTARRLETGDLLQRGIGTHAGWRRVAVDGATLEPLVVSDLDGVTCSLGSRGVVCVDPFGATTEPVELPYVEGAPSAMAMLGDGDENRIALAWPGNLRIATIHSAGDPATWRSAHALLVKGAPSSRLPTDVYGLSDCVFVVARTEAFCADLDEPEARTVRPLAARSNFSRVVGHVRVRGPEGEVDAVLLAGTANRTQRFMAIDVSTGAELWAYAHADGSTGEAVLSSHGDTPWLYFVDARGTLIAAPVDLASRGYELAP